MIAHEWIITNPTTRYLVPFTVVAVNSSYRCRGRGATELECGRHVRDSHGISVVEIDEESYRIEVIPAKYR